MATISHRVVSLRSRALIRTGRSEFVPHVHSPTERLGAQEGRIHSSRDRFLAAIQRAAAEARLRELLAHVADDDSREADPSVGSLEDDTQSSAQSDEWAPEFRSAGHYPGHRHSAPFNLPAGILRGLHPRHWVPTSDHIDSSSSFHWFGPVSRKNHHLDFLHKLFSIPFCAILACVLFTKAL